MNGGLKDYEFSEGENLHFGHISTNFGNKFILA
jgi:hypothetical protein